MRCPAPRPFPGGPLAVDLLNTRWRVDDHEVDWLADDEAVVAFSDTYGVRVRRADIGTARSALMGARGLIQRLIRDGTNGAPGHNLVTEINTVLTAATVSVTTSTTAPGLSIVSSDPTRSVAVQAIINAVELLRDYPGRIRSCHNDHCVLWFFDTSKSGQRRWCTMERCGNRAKVKRHYARTRVQ
jgi:predicted RNA-binding Zn ribbon-like protein